MTRISGLKNANLPIINTKMLANQIVETTDKLGCTRPWVDYKYGTQNLTCYVARELFSIYKFPLNFAIVIEY